MADQQRIDPGGPNGRNLFYRFGSGHWGGAVVPGGPDAGPMFRRESVGLSELVGGGSVKALAGACLGAAVFAYATGTPISVMSVAGPVAVAYGSVYAAGMVGSAAGSELAGYATLAVAVTYGMPYVGVGGGLVNDALAFGAVAGGEMLVGGMAM